MTTPDGGGLTATVRAGDYRASLEAIRDRLAGFLDGLSDRQLLHAAPLSKQLTDTLEKIAALPVPDAAADSVETAQSDLEAKLRLVQ